MTFFTTQPKAYQNGHAAPHRGDIESLQDLIAEQAEQIAQLREDHAYQVGLLHRRLTKRKDEIEDLKAAIAAAGEAKIEQVEIRPPECLRMPEDALGRLKRMAKGPNPMTTKMRLQALLQAHYEAVLTQWVLGTDPVGKLVGNWYVTDDRINDQYKCFCVQTFDEVYRNKAALASRMSTWLDKPDQHLVSEHGRLIIDPIGRTVGGRKVDAVAERHDGGWTVILEGDRKPVFIHTFELDKSRAPSTRDARAA